MRLASVMLIKRIAHPGPARCCIPARWPKAREKSRCFAVAWVFRVQNPPALVASAPVLEGDPKKQDRVHLVKLAHLAINAQPAGPLTGTYNKLSKYLRANPHGVSRFLHAFQADISTYLRCYNDDTLCKPLFIKAVLHCTHTPQCSPGS
jgi:hypothetical protein